MSNVIEGKNCLLQMKVSGSWKDILCATDMSFDYSPEFITKTGPGSPAREFALRLSESSMSVTGLTKIAVEDDVLSFFYMIQTAVRRSIQEFRATFINDSGGTQQISGFGFIGHSTINGPATDFCNAFIEIKMSGAFSIDEITIPADAEFNYLSDWWNTSGGTTFIDQFSTGETDGTPYRLGTDDIILEVDYEGNQFDQVSGTPTPGKRECKFTATNLTDGKISFPSDLVSDGTQRVFVLFKRAI